MGILGIKRCFSVVCLWSLIISVSVTAETKATHLVSQPESKIWLTGDSTLHSYESTATKIEFSAELQKTEDLRRALQNHQLKKLDITIPVKSLKSGKKSLDRNMHKLLLADQNPTIRFHLTRYEAKPFLHSSKNEFLIEATGTLSLADVGKTISLEANAELSDAGLHIRGEKELLMTDFGIKPPVMLILKTDDRVIVHYDIFLSVESTDERKKP